jgi:hypothetical protein
MVRAGAWLLAAALLVAGSSGALGCPNNPQTLPAVRVEGDISVTLLDIVSKLPADQQGAVTVVAIESGENDSGSKLVDSNNPDTPISTYAVVDSDVSSVNLVPKSPFFGTVNICIKTSLNGTAGHFAVPITFVAVKAQPSQPPPPTPPPPPRDKLQISVDHEMDASRPQVTLYTALTAPRPDDIESVVITIATKGGTATINGVPLPKKLTYTSAREPADLRTLVVFPDPSARPETLMVSADVTYSDGTHLQAHQPVNVSKTIPELIMGGFQQLPGWFRVALVVAGFVAIVLAIYQGGLYLWSALMTFFGKKEKFEGPALGATVEDLKQVIEDNFAHVFTRLKALEDARSASPPAASTTRVIRGNESGQAGFRNPWLNANPPAKQEPTGQQKIEPITRRYAEVVKDLSLSDDFVRDFRVQGATESGEGYVLNSSHRDVAFWAVPLDANGGNWLLLPGRASIKNWADFLAPMNGSGALEQLGGAYELERGAELRIVRPARALYERSRNTLVVADKGLLSGIN